MNNGYQSKVQITKKASPKMFVFPPSTVGLSMWLFDSIDLLGAFHCSRFVGHFGGRLRERFQEFVGSVVPSQKPPEILNVFAGPYRRRGACRLGRDRWHSEPDRLLIPNGQRQVTPRVRSREMHRCRVFPTDEF